MKELKEDLVIFMWAGIIIAALHVMGLGLITVAEVVLPQEVIGVLLK